MDSTIVPQNREASVRMTATLCRRVDGDVISARELDSKSNERIAFHQLAHVVQSYD